MIYLLLRWVLNTLVLLMISYLVPGVSFASFWSALITAAVFGIINATIRPIVILLTLPVNILTLGLLTFVINALMFWLASAVVKGFEVSNFTSAFWGALIYAIVVSLINYIDSPQPKRA